MSFASRGRSDLRESASGSSSETTRLQRWRNDSLVRTAGALVLNSGLTSVLGVGYWVVVARVYDPADLANNAALISTMLVLCGICQMNLGLSIGALLPRAGRRAGHLLMEMYAATTAVTVVVVAVFIVFVAPHLDYVDAVLGSLPKLLLFGGAVAAYNFFVLQDSALAALGRPMVVPIENTVFGAAKILLVVGLVGVSGTAGIFISWSVPAALLVIPVTIYLVRSVIPRHTAEPSGPIRLQHAVVRVTGDYVGFLFLIGSTLALPAIAVSLLGAERSAAFAVPWLLSSSLDTVASNIAIALTIEGSRESAASPELRSRTTRRALPLVVGLAVLMIVLAPLVLRLYGGVYARDGVSVLRLLLLAAPLRAIAVLAMGEARAQGRIRFIVALQALSSFVVVVGAIVLSSEIGIEGIAVAWLTAQAIAAAVSLYVGRSRRRSRPVSSTESGGAVATIDSTAETTTRTTRQRLRCQPAVGS